MNIINLTIYMNIINLSIYIILSITKAFNDQENKVDYVRKRYSVFTTTLNLGEATLASFEQDISNWVLEGHDIYAIGKIESMYID